MGSGELRDSLRDRINAQSMSRHVFLLGTVEDPATILRGSDAFLLPSATEVRLDATPTSAPTASSNLLPCR